MIQSGERKARGYRPGPSGNWREGAACRGLADQYFDPWDCDDTAQLPNATAVQFCHVCPVRQRCLVEAIKNDEPVGVWGGLTRKQRVSLQRSRKRIRCPICDGNLINDVSVKHSVCNACGISWRSRNPMISH